MLEAPLRIELSRPLRACNAGLFVSRGKGTHPERVIDSHELIYVRRGKLAMQENAREFFLDPGQTLLLWPGRRHKGIRDYPADLSFYWIHFQLTAPSGKKRAKPRASPLIVPQHATLRREDKLAELFHRFLDDQESGRPDPAAAALLILLMLCEVAGSRAATEIAATGAAEALAARARKLVQTRYHLPITTSDIADELNCNADYLGRVYRRAYGHTLIDEIHRSRLRSARRLLMESALNVDQIARECGFADSGYFRRIFRRAQGLSPRAFRKLYARAHVNTE
jgi:AraC-like DNA-binding protein